MAYCSNCGNMLDDKAIICVKCGEPCGKKKANPNDTSGGGWLLVLSIIAPAIGFIVGLVLHNEGKVKLAKRCFTGCVIGLIVGGIIAVLAFLLPYAFLFLI